MFGFLSNLPGDDERTLRAKQRRRRIAKITAVAGALVCTGIIAAATWGKDQCIEKIVPPFVVDEEEDDVSTADTAEPTRSIACEPSTPHIIVPSLRVQEYKKIVNKKFKLPQLSGASALCKQKLKLIGYVGQVGGNIYHDHPDGALMRAACEEIAYEVALQIADTMGVPVTDIGGNYCRHHKYRRRCHTCTPILDAADEERHRKRQEILNKPGAVNCPHVTTCDNALDESLKCPIAAKSVWMIIDACYYINVKLMYDHVQKGYSVILYGHKHAGKNPIQNSTHEVQDGVVKMRIKGNNFDYVHPVFDWDFSSKPAGVEVVDLLGPEFTEGPDNDDYLVLLRPTAAGDITIADDSVWARGSQVIATDSGKVKVPVHLLDQAIKLDVDPTTPAWDSMLSTAFNRMDRRFEEGLSQFKTPEMIAAIREYSVYNYRQRQRDARCAYRKYGWLSAGKDLRDGAVRIAGSLHVGYSTCVLSGLALLGLDDPIYCGAKAYRNFSEGNFWSGSGYAFIAALALTASYEPE